MKTNYESPEDQLYLSKIFSRAIMSTDAIWEMAIDEPQLKDYFIYLIELRRKIFEFSGTDDFNKDVLDGLYKKLNGPKENL